MRRFVVLLYWGTRGGGSLFTLQLAEHLMRGDPDLAVTVSLRRENVDLAAFRASGAECRVVDLGSLGGVARAPWHALAAYAAELRELRRRRPVAVVVTMNAILAAPLAPLVRAAGLRLVYVAHDAAPHPGDYLARLQRLAQGLLLRSADEVVALSDAVATQLRHPRVRTIPIAAVTPPAERPHPAMPPVGPVRLLVLGRLIAYKGLPLLRDALERLRRRDDWRLTVAGDGPLAPWLRAAFAGWPQVTLEIGWLEEARIDALMDAHHLLVCPYTEASQSGVVPRALARGLPVAVTPEGALPEQVRPLHPALVAAASTPEALADTIARWLDDPARLAALSADARALAAQADTDRGWFELLRAPPSAGP